MTAAIDYTSKDFDAYRYSLLEYARRVFPEWSQSSEGDFGMLMVELFAYVADIQSYYSDRIANESFLVTATQRRSVLAIADMLAYTPSGNIAATGTVTLVSNNPGPSVVVPAGTQLATSFVMDADAPLIFEAVTDVTVPADGGTVVANVVQGVTIHEEIVATSDGTIDQDYTLYNVPVIDNTVVVDVGDATNGYHSWRFLQHLIDATPVDYVFSTYTDEAGVVHAEFGDGVNGVVPGAHATIRATYRIGGGIIGNVSAGQVTTLVAAIDGVSISVDGNGVAQSSAMTGGADAESLDQIRANAPRSFQTQNRCVALADYENAALGVAAVSKAKAVANHFSSVTVYIVGPGGAVPTPAVLTSASAYLNDRQRCGAGTTVVVAPSVPVTINISLQLGILPQYKVLDVKNTAIQTLQSLFAIDNVSFGSRVALSTIYATLALVPGVDYASVSVLTRADGSPTALADVLCRDWEIPVAGTFTLTSIVGGII